MKRTLLVVTIASILLAAMAFGQSVGDFRSAATGNWSAPTTWETYNGSGWVAASTFPVSTDGNIAVRNSHNVAVDTSIAVDQVSVETGGTLTIQAAKTLTIANGPDSLDMAVAGSLNNFGTVTPIGALNIGNGGLYIHSIPVTGGAVPTAIWGTGSTCRFDSVVSASPTNVTNQSFYNFVWNCPRQGSNIGLNFPDNYVFRGSVTVTNTNNMQWRFTNLSAGQTKTINVLGDILVNGPTALLTGSGSGADTAARVVLNVSGNITVQSGTFNTQNSGSAYGRINLKGDLTISGGSVSINSSRTWRNQIYFVKNGSQSFTKTGGTIGAATFGVDSGAIVQLNSPLSLVNDSVRIVNGKILTSAANLLTLDAASNIAAIAGFVDGPMAHTVATTSEKVRFFPIGKGTAYRPLTFTVTQDAGTATVYTAEVTAGSPPTRALPPTLDSVSSVRYFKFAKSSGAGISSTGGASFLLTYGADDLVADSSLLRVAKDDGAGAWTNLGGSGSASGSGTINSNLFYTLNATNDVVLATARPNNPVLLATVTTASVTNISTATATCGGNITNDGGGAITARGVCWSIANPPTVSDSITLDGTGSGAYTSAITGLIAGSRYFIRAYATNSAGSAYGAVDSFTTLSSLTVPIVTTDSVTTILATNARSGGNVTFWGGVPVTARGVCWNTTGNPTTADRKTVNGSGTGTFTSQLGGLALGTTYYVRAYATNSVGTGYGNQRTFVTPPPQPDMRKVVAQNGTGDYTTVQAAFNAVPDGYTGRWTIFVKRGVYYEKILLAASKVNVVLIGEERDSTILTYDDYSGRIRDSVVIGTSTSYSVAIDGADFIASNITFRNTATQAQAVALRVNGDRATFYDCNLLGYQDTYYTWGGSGTVRTYHKNCYIQGSVDFIFGRNIVLFDACRINVNRNGGTITAAATDLPAKFGYVFKNCTISNDSIGFDGNPITTFYLGRPWQSAPRTVFMGCYEPARLNAAGWLSWNVPPALYAEYQCSGPGYQPSLRVPWSSQLPDSVAARYTMQNIFAMDSYEPQFAFDWTPPPPPSLTSVDDNGVEKSVPQRFELQQNYPNPFNPETLIKFSVQQSGRASLSVYNLLGQHVATLFDGVAEPGREYTVKFNSRGMSSGVYFYRLHDGSQTALKKLIILK